MSIGFVVGEKGRRKKKKGEIVIEFETVHQAISKRWTWRNTNGSRFNITPGRRKRFSPFFSAYNSTFKG